MLRTKNVIKIINDMINLKMNEKLMNNLIQNMNVRLNIILIEMKERYFQIQFTMKCIHQQVGILHVAHKYKNDIGQYLYIANI